MGVASGWVRNNSAIIALTQSIEWDIEGIEGLDLNGWYLLNCNHQTWVDIPILQRLFIGQIPFVKFFLKQELIWVPLMGLAWWALDFPFMKRYSSAHLKKHPELRGKDMETTRRACARFKHQPTTIMNFLEGTRFTPAKHDQQQSPYTHLLKPKAGGIAFVLSAMGGQIRSMIDVTIAYHDKKIGMWDLLSGGIHKVSVRVRLLTIPQELLAGDYENDPEFKRQFQEWVNQLWREKDLLLAQLKGTPAPIIS